ncbi:MAG: DUF2892 domain-containing protein [Rubricoccaceae bacterium]
MQCNMGKTDRALRLGAAAGLAGLILSGRVRGLGALALGTAAAVFAGTSATGYCPAYEPLGVDTRSADERAADRAEAEA